MTPKTALKYCTELQAAVKGIGQQATQELSAGDLRPDDDDEEGWEALAVAERQVLDAHRIPCGTGSLSFREVEASLAAIKERLNHALEFRGQVSDEDQQALSQLSSLTKASPPCEDRGWFEAKLEAMPVASSEWLQQLAAAIRVSLRLPSTSAQVRVSDIELTATSEPLGKHFVGYLSVRFRAYMLGRQGDNLTELLSLAQVRLALPNRGPVELPLTRVTRIAEPAPEALAA